jgi:3-hydroxybutyrate dehydrogenase
MQRQSLAEAHDVDIAYNDADMSQPDAILRMVDQANHRFGEVDIIINTAGNQHVAPVVTFPV